MLLNIYKERLDHLDMHDLVNSFISSNDQRRRVFHTVGHFPVTESHVPRVNWTFDSYAAG